MRAIAIAFAGLVGLSVPSFAGDVISKCTEAMTSVGATNVEQGCTCFEKETSGDLAPEYLALDIAQWNEKASDGLKQAAATCFPDSNTNE